MNYLCFNQLLYKLIDDSCFDDNGKIREEIKYSINNSKFNIQNSKFIGKIGDKFETLLFLPPNPDRKGEGGLRTKGLFKFNYRKVRSKKLEVRNDLKRKDKNVNDSECVWYICDYYGNLLISVPSSHLSLLTSHLSPLTFSPLTSFPLITIITVVFNGAKYLEDTIKSVINQTYPNIEYIIIDGGSKDGTLDVIKKYEDYIDYWVSEPDNGIYDAMNKGIILSNGEWLNFMNCGDSFSSVDILSNIFTSINLEDIDLIYSDIKIGNDFVYICDIKKNKVIHQSLIYKKILHNEFGFYLDNKKVMVSDYIFFMLSKNKKWFKYDKPIANYNIDGVSNKNITTHVKQKIGADLIFGNIGVFRSCIMLLFYPLYRLLKRMILKK
jgi:hypothetical protein